MSETIETHAVEPETIETHVVEPETIETHVAPETQTQALQILISALQLAQSRGAFKISESSRILEAIVLFK